MENATKQVYKYGDVFLCLKEQSYKGMVSCITGKEYKCLSFNYELDRIVIYTEPAFRWLMIEGMDDFHKDFKWISPK